MTEINTPTPLKKIINAEEYLKERLEGQINYHRDNSKKNKTKHYRAQVLIIVFSALIPALIGYTDKFEYLKYIAGALGAAVSIVSGIVALFRFQDSWHNSRSTMEAVKREKFVFLTRTGEYKAAEDESKEAAEQRAFETFVLRVEDILGQENETWRSISNTQAQQNT